MERQFLDFLELAQRSERLGPLLQYLFASFKNEIMECPDARNSPTTSSVRIHFGAC